MQPTKKRKRRPPAKKPGPKSDLTLELFSKIKEQIILGHNFVKTQQILKIPKSTWDTWTNENREHFRDKLALYKQESLLRRAEINLSNIIDMPTIEPVIGMFGPVVDKKTGKPVKKENDRLLAIKKDVSIFVAETVGRKTYSKKLELDDVTDKKRVLID